MLQRYGAELAKWYCLFLVELGVLVGMDLAGVPAWRTRRIEISQKRYLTEREH